LPVDKAQTASEPVMVEDGSAITFTAFVLVELHDPLDVVNVSVNVHVDVPAFTETEDVVADPTIVPFPLMLQA